jgi:penicillin-binding protein 1A
MRMKRHAVKRRRRGRRIVTVVAVTLSFGIVGGAAAVWSAVEPYTHAGLDMTLMDIPRINRPAAMTAFEPSDRAARTGKAHEAEGCDLAVMGNDSFTPYENVPTDLINAFISIEDKRFWRHGGVDFIRTAHAALRYLTGNPSFGGSTVTQQLIKNLTGEDECTVERKLTEIFRSNHIRSVTLTRMTVPCCGGLAMAVKRAIEQSGRQIP